METSSNNHELVEKLFSLSDLKFEKDDCEFQINMAEKTIKTCESDIKQLNKKHNALKKTSPIEVLPISPTTTDIASRDVRLELIDADLGIGDNDYDEDASLEYETPELDKAYHKMKNICSKANSLSCPIKPRTASLDSGVSFGEALTDLSWLWGVGVFGFVVLFLGIMINIQDKIAGTIFCIVGIAMIVSPLVKTIIVYFGSRINAKKENDESEKQYAQNMDKYAKSVETYIATINKYIADYNACSKSIYKCQFKAIESCIETAKKRIEEEETKLEKLHSELTKIEAHIAESQYDYFDIRNYDGAMLHQLASYLKEGRASTYQDAVNLYYQEEAQEQARREAWEIARERARREEEARVEKERNEEAAARKAAHDARWERFDQILKRCDNCTRRSECTYKDKHPENCSAFIPR